MTYTISYQKNGVYQAIGVNAQSAEQATAYFTQYKPTAEFIGIREGMENKPGFPVITVPDDFQEAKEEAQEAAEEAHKEEPKNENREYCKRVALELEAYVNGHMHQDENGEAVYSEEDRDDLDQLCIGDYMSTEVLDFDIVIGGNWEYKSCKLYVTLGGPNVWIDTAEKAVKLAWGTDREECGLDWNVCDEIDQYWAETYACARGGR